jgi:hypothetical protein
MKQLLINHASKHINNPFDSLFLLVKQRRIKCHVENISGIDFDIIDLGQGVNDLCWTFGRCIVTGGNTVGKKIARFTPGRECPYQLAQPHKHIERHYWQAIYKTFGGYRMKTNQEWAEVCFIPSAIGRSKHAPVYRYLAITEAMSSEIPGLELPEPSLPFPTFEIRSQRYKLFGVVTKSEEAHAVMKEDFAGGKLPSEDFGENAAWWWIICALKRMRNSGLR